MQSTPVDIRKPWYRRASIGIAVDVVIAVGGVTLARLMGSLTQIVLARRLGLEDFGVYTTFFTLLGPVIMVASMGLDTWLLREGGRRTDLDDTIGQVFSLRLLTTGVLMVLAVAVLAATGRTSFSLPVVLAALGLTAELLLTTAHTALRAQVRNVAASLLQVLVAALTIGLIMVAWNPQQPLLSATGYRLLADTIGLAVMVWLLGRSLRHIGFRLARLWSMVYAARHFFATDVLSNIALKADLILVALVIGPVAAGIYSPALLIVNTTFVVPMVAWQVLLPLVSRMEPRSPVFRRTLGMALAGSVAYGILWLLVLTWGARPLIDAIFRPEYQMAVPLLQIMALIPLLKSLNFCSAMLMVARDRQVLRNRFLAIAAVFNLAANVVAIPIFGLEGAAWINLATETVLLVGYGIGAWRVLRQR